MLQRSWIDKDKDRLSLDKGEDSEEDIEASEQFERKYNFRHEEV